ncbi:MAG: hypothetical protein JNL63_05135 [Bacteroidia bacterium]|nr:hypothetical protein [Bacteroidia bacterium]
MGCSGCSTGRGCSTASGSLPGGCRNNGSCGVGGCNKLNVFDWLSNMELPGGTQPCDVVEVRFKNSRKEFFRNVNNLSLAVGDVVAVEASPGHDIGGVSMTGELVRIQLKKKGLTNAAPDIKKVYRKARQNDIDKWREAQALEEKTMHRSRTIAVALGLQMKISDVEYQGDKTKAIFYYTADDRVDFRELIKKYAEEFRVRIEMRQIGARQEASRLGGIGSCGRELCCSTWLTDFRSVSTSAARYQQLSLNPLKLAGQCGKLKCCLNYELDSYLDAIKDFPDVNDVKLKSKKGDAVHQKTDIFRRTMWFSYFDQMNEFIPIPVDRVKEIIEMNKKGELPADLGEAFKEKERQVTKREPDYENVVGQDSLTRFDTARKKKKKKHHNKNRNRPRPAGANKPGPQNKPGN